MSFLSLSHWDIDDSQAVKDHQRDESSIVCKMCTKDICFSIKKRLPGSHPLYTGILCLYLFIYLCIYFIFVNY